jgi:hypothetical protein
MYLSRIGIIFLPITCLIFFLLACDRPAHHPRLKDSSIQPAARIPTVGRDALIRELQALHTRIASNDKNEISKLFTFPIPDSLISLYSADSAFDAEWRKNGVLSENVYYAWFGKISIEWQLTEFNKVFTSLDVAQLLHKDKLHHDAIVSTEPCYKNYSIEIDEDSLVNVSYGSNRSDKYKGTVNAEEVYRCEFQTFWTFVFDGTKLRFVRQNSAG